MINHLGGGGRVPATTRGKYKGISYSDAQAPGALFSAAQHFPANLDERAHYARLLQPPVRVRHDDLSSVSADRPRKPHEAGRTLLDKNKKAVGEHAHSDAGNRKPWEIAKVSSKRVPRLAVEEWIVESWSTSLRKQLSIQHQRPATSPREFSCLFVQTGT